MTSFETETCSRCHGAGNYSYCQDYGTTCFKCAGSKITLTKRGQAAKAYYNQLCSKPASQVIIGDKIRITSLTRGGKLFNYIASVVEIKSRKGVQTTVKTLRADGKTLDVKYKVEYDNTEGFSVLSSSGGTVEWSGEAGTFIDEFTEYIFITESKYGKDISTTERENTSIQVYNNNADLLAKAIEYQATLTKLGNPRKK